MGRGRGFLRWSAALCVGLLLGAGARPASAQPHSELSADVVEALQRVEDFTLHFDQDGVYSLIDSVRDSEQPPGHSVEPIRIDNWRDLLERPGDFRGLPITVQGVVGHNRAWRRANSTSDEPVWQIELSSANQPIACTILLTSDVSDVPIGATMNVTGYFAMIRRYYTSNNAVREAALLVAQGPTFIAQASTTQVGGGSWTTLIVAMTAGLLFAWWLLRRTIGHRQHDLHQLHATRSAPLDLSEDLQRWADQDDESGGPAK